MRIVFKKCCQTVVKRFFANMQIIVFTSLQRFFLRGSTPVYSTIKKGFEIPYFMVFRAFFIAILQYFKPF